MSLSIGRRLLVSNLLILSAFLGLAGIALDRAFRTSSEAAARERLQAHVYTLLTAATEDERGRMRLPQALAAPAFNQPDSGLYARVSGEAGSYHWRSGSLLGRSVPLAIPSRPGETHFRLAESYAVLDQGIAWEDDRGEPIDYVITVAISRASLDAGQAGFRKTLWQWLGGVALVLLAAQMLSLRWGLTPLRDMSRAVRRMETGEAGRIEGEVPRELLGLSRNLNAMIEQNNRRQERVRHSLADLAHSLKTPLAVLRGATGQSADAGLQALIDEQTARIDEIVRYQRQRAAVAGSGGITRPVPLTPILLRLCASLDKVHRGRGLHCQIGVEDGLRVRVDEGDLFELFGNLLENAYKHCRTRVRVSATMGDGQLLIDVEDDGEGIGDQDAERLLRRGERADLRHPGEGIGLAVVSEIVRQYGGSLTIRPSDLGGACLRVGMPV